MVPLANRPLCLIEFRTWREPETFTESVDCISELTQWELTVSKRFLQLVIRTSSYYKYVSFQWYFINVIWYQRYLIYLFSLKMNYMMVEKFSKYGCVWDSGDIRRYQRRHTTMEYHNSLLIWTGNMSCALAPKSTLILLLHSYGSEIKFICILSIRLFCGEFHIQAYDAITPTDI